MPLPVGVDSEVHRFVGEAVGATNPCDATPWRAARLRSVSCRLSRCDHRPLGDAAVLSSPEVLEQVLEGKSGTGMSSSHQERLVDGVVDSRLR